MVNVPHFNLFIYICSSACMCMCPKGRYSHCFLSGSLKDALDLGLYSCRSDIWP